jgi:plastocyanin
MSSRTSVLAALLVVVAVAGCGSGAGSTSSSATPSSSSSAAAAPAKRSAHVVISNYGYHPASEVVAPGSRITFTNRDMTAHTATATGGAFDTGTLKPGASRTVLLRKPGTYTYYCQFHAFMRGTVTVR